MIKHDFDNKANQIRKSTKNLDSRTIDEIDENSNDIDKIDEFSQHFKYLSNLSFRAHSKNF